MRCVGVGFAIAIGASGCKPGAPAGTTDAGIARAVDAAAPLPPRCVAVGAAQPIGDGAIEFGEAVRDGDRVDVGVARELRGARTGSIAFVRAGSQGVGPVEVKDVGPLPADAPPPKPLLAVVNAPVTVSYGKKDGGGPSLDVKQWGKDVDAWSFDLRANDSFDVDAIDTLPVGGVLAAWGDAESGRGVIRVGARGAAPVAVSPATTDADSPRFAARAGGHWLAWIAHKVDPPRDAAPELEGPGEKRGLAWIEVLALDAKGNPDGAPRAVGATKHVEAFDLEAREDGALDLVVKDDEEPGDGAGARLLLVTLRGAEEEKRVLVGDGVGNGVPDLLGPWIAYADVHDKSWIVPRAPLGRPSAEPALDGARPLAALGSGILAGFPGDSAHALRLFACGPAPAPSSERPTGKQ